MLCMPITCFLYVCGTCHDSVCSCHKKSDNNHVLHRAEPCRKLSFGAVDGRVTDPETATVKPRSHSRLTLTGTDSDNCSVNVSQLMLVVMHIDEENSTTPKQSSLRIIEIPRMSNMSYNSLADSGGGGAQGARPAPFEIPKRVFKEGQRGRTPPAPPPLFKFQRGSSNGTAAAPPLFTNPGSTPVII